MIPESRIIPAHPGVILAQALNTTPEYRTNLQAAHDLARSRPTRAVRPLRVAS